MMTIRSSAHGSSADATEWRRLCLEASASIATTPLTIRIDLDPQ
jgi:hypothetical protein